VTVTDTGVAAQSRLSRLRLHGIATWLRLLLAVFVVTFLVYYVGPRATATTLFKVVAAVGISAAFFIAANKLFDLTYTAWTWFCAIAGFAVGFAAFAVLDGNHVLRELPARPWLWGLIGGLVVGGAMFVLAAVVPDDKGSTSPSPMRLPVAVGAFAAIGVVLAVAVSPDKQPALDWSKLLLCTAVSAVGFGLLQSPTSGSPRRLGLSAVTGAGVGWLIGAWGGAEYASLATAEATEKTGGGNLAEALVASVVGLALIGVAVGLRRPPPPTRRREIEQRSRAWIFAAPALIFIAGGLLIPLVRTVIQSLGNNDSSEYVGLDNYRSVITSPAFFTAENWDWGNIFGSRLFWIAAVATVIGLVIGLVNGRVVRRPFEATPGSVIVLLIAFFFAACLVLGTLRGSIVNNVWWVIVVTILSTAFGLAVAVLSDRAKGENVAKSLIFLPLAISFVGAGVIWTLIYQTRNVSKAQTGVLNALWIGLGELSNSGWQRLVVAAVVLAIVAGLAYLGYHGVRAESWSQTGVALGIGVLLIVFVAILLFRGIGGYVETADGVEMTISNVIADQPYNNMWLMVVLIWIQTGFAMVIFSSAIKAVPTEFVEAARIDGATESQTFWRITLPQILPTVGVVVTTLIVAVMKVYDIVFVMTGGQFSTSVIAFDMIEEINFANFGRSATFATLLFVAILPVMIYNIRKMQKARA
jgi:alpha-glucoside transport system permease protein